MTLLMRLLGGLGQRLLVLLFAVSAAQFPLYYLAYANTLAGAVQESESRYQQLQQEAAQLQLSVEEFIQRHETSANETFIASGRIHRTTLEHYLRYAQMQTALREAPVWQRPLALARNFDPVLHAATRFAPGLPLTSEGGAYALAGLLTGWLLTGVAGGAIRRRFKPRT